ncbi:conserved oligomeric Golgi complex subunit 5 [Macrosteles quadrilineatus]|uniref:conserved oligomeric Golgi complex subunit 5 n=1 Tax=Macrosteles quadrilineatus TaxID=74068 RepID=UPI0023E2B460|nr:conserved oligomeric Golgi complex subunit 5 [Macrosteles quadrilineatus]
MGGATDVWDEIQKDEYLKQIITKKENPDQLNPSHAISATLAVSEQLTRLTQGIHLLEKELHVQVLENHEHLVSQATWVDRLENILANMQNNVQRLLLSVERLRSKVVEPFNKLETQTVMLARLHATSDLLRRTARIHQLTKRLSNSDVVRAAAIINELEELCRDVDMTGLDMVQEDLRLMRTETQRVEREAEHLLSSGLAALSQSDISTAFQVFQSLGIQEREVNLLLENILSKIKNTSEKALDIQSLNQNYNQERNAKSKATPGRASGGTYPGNITNFRNALWTGWEQVLTSTIFTYCCQIALVQKVLRSSQGINGFTSGLEKGSDIAALFWSQINETLTKLLSEAAQNSSFIKQALEGEYPKLLRLLLDLHKKLQADPTTSGIYPNPGDCGHQFETAYLSRSIARLLDSVHGMFSSEVPPTTEQVDNLIRTITNELSVSLVEDALSLTVARNIGKAMQLFHVKAEQMLSVGGEATQVIEPPTTGQLLNVSVANIVFYLMTQVKRVVTNMASSLPSASVNELNKSLTNANSLTRQILAPLVSSVDDSVEAIILTMHQEDFNREENSQGPSPYMRELQTFIQRVVSVYLVPYQHHQVVGECMQESASKCLELFLRHVSLVRPISTSGRLRLVNDMKQIEVALAPLCPQLVSLGRVYRLLRQFRSLVEVSVPEQVAECPLLGELVPHSLALMSLFSFAPPELPSPHQSANWSVARLSKWLDSHSSEKERLELINGALQKYQQTVRNQNKETFHPVYPIMMQMLERGFLHISQNTS